MLHTKMMKCAVMATAAATVLCAHALASDVISTTDANVRSGPNIKASIVTVFKQGSTAEKLGTSGNWVQVKVNGQTGYVYKTYVKDVTDLDTTETSTTSTTDTADVVSIESVNVRSQPNQNSTVVTILQKGATAQKLGTSGNWVQVKVNGQTGYVYKTYVKDVTDSDTTETSTTSTTDTADVVSIESVNVRSQPNQNSAVVTILQKGATAQKLGTSGNWVQVKVNGQTGYVYKTYVKNSDGSAVAATSTQSSTTTSTVSSTYSNVYSSYSTNYYSGNINRTNNLSIACSVLDGKIIKAGETFSFNSTLGVRSAAKGYLPATVFTSSTTSDEQLGGGICQVSSTLFNAALLANLDIVSRYQHSQAISYCPLGRDAAVYYGSKDFVFKNTTDYDLQIHATVSGGTMTIQFLTKEQVSPKPVVLNVSRNDKTYTLTRSVNGTVNYTATSTY